MSKTRAPHEDQRRYTRLQSYKSAQLVPDDRSSPIPVHIIDMSAAGAKLELRAPARPPAAFKLVLRADSPEESKAVNCQRLWQRDGRIGVRFC